MSGQMSDTFSKNPLASMLGGCSPNMGMGAGMGMMPGFGGACNPMGSMFGGMMQQQQQTMMLMMMMLMQMMQMMQNGCGGLNGSACNNAANGASPSGFAPSASGAPASGTPGAGAPASGSPAASGSLPIQGQKMGVAKGTGYYPDNSPMEGGYVDKKGAKLCTLQDFLNGKAPYVSIALDNNLYKSGQVKYGDTFRIPELEAKYGKQIIFKAVDTGGAFTGKGFGRVDICTASKKDSYDSTVNGNLTLIKTS